MIDIEKTLKEMSLEEKASMCSGRDFWHTQNIERLGIPSVMVCDGPHGLRKQEGEGDHLGINVSIETTCYPSAAALASSFDRNVLHTLGVHLGKECQAEDVGMLLGPGLNMKRSPLCGRNFEYFSEDPYLAGELASSYITGLQSEGVAACVKHFAANNQETMRMSGTSQVDERTFHEIYLPAFENAVKNGKTRSVMCAYNAVNDVYCAENKELLTDILREQWGFDGFVVTDWGAVKDRVKGLLAGLDLEMPGGAGVQDQQIVAAVKNGTLDETVLDEAVRHVLKFVDEYMDNRKEEAAIDRKDDHAVSGKLAEQCAILLKNDGILPLAEEENVLIVGEFAESPRYQGAGSSHINTKNVVSACMVKKDVPYAQGYDVHNPERSAVLIEEACEKAAHADKVIVFAGLPDSYETEGCDRTDLYLPKEQNDLIDRLTEVNKNIAVVLHGGAPVEIPWIAKVKAVMCMYLAGEDVGEAEVNLLWGRANPSGHLAETWPLRIEDTPAYINFPGEQGTVKYAEGIFIGYRYYDKRKMNVLFPFGHGLSYTEFTYSDLHIENGEKITVSCKVRNSGTRSGAEVIQLYVGDPSSAVIRPVRELKGFEKICLEPGEEREVKFTLDKKSFAYYEVKIHDWFTGNGEYTIEIGSSSRDIRLEGKVQIDGGRELPMTYTRLSTVSDLMKTEKGRAVMQQMMAARAQSDGKNKEEMSARTMGEGSEKMVQNMIREMPLSNLVTYGAMTFEQLDGLIYMLNQN